MSIAITFDDGYLEHAKLARLLAKLKIRATFYIITHLKRFEGKSLLTQKEELIAEIASLGHEIGSHTCTHRMLTKLDTMTLEIELRDSKKFLENLTGQEVIGLAYPYGVYNIKIIDTVRKYYYYARAADIMPWDDPLNVNTRDRYQIASASIRTIHRVLESLIDPSKRYDIRPSIFIHEAKLFKLIPLITVFKALHLKFITMKELIELIEKNSTDISQAPKLVMSFTK